MNCPTHSRRRFGSRKVQRGGSVIVLTAVALVILLLFAAMIIDISWMSSLQTEAQLATDISTRGALAAFVNDRSDDPYEVRVARAQAVGQTIFESSMVGTVPLTIDPEDFKFGVRTDDGFVESSEVANAVRLSLTEVNPDGFDLFLAPLFGIDHFNTSPASTVAFNPIDIVLCLDISRSMAWSVGENAAPGGVSIHQPPVEGARWLALVDSVNTFLEKAEAQVPSLRVSLVTFGGGEHREVDTPWDLTAARIETDLEFVGAARSEIDASLNFITQNTLAWRTPTIEGLQTTELLFDTQSSEEGVRKIAILLSDGVATTGSPTAAAQSLAAKGVTISTIYFAGDATGEEPLRLVAEAAGGSALNADNPDELDAAFNLILSLLSVRMVE